MEQEVGGSSPPNCTSANDQQIAFPRPAKAPARRRFWPALIQTERQSGTMGRENLLFWLSIAWLVLLCGGVVWALVGL